ncbi:MAG: rhomboid family intramembrane serine protease [Candidatus Binataceae bacterium]
MAANTALIAINVAVYVYEVALGRHGAAFIGRFALHPDILTAWAGLGRSSAVAQLAASWPLWPPATLVTSAFLHAGLFHVAGNMLYLYVFGAAVEQRLGHARFVAFYLACAVAAALAFVVLAPGTTVAVIGASGAVAGVLGAYFVLMPRGRVVTIVPIFFFVQVAELPAVLYLLLWFAVQLYAGIRENTAAGVVGGVAWWAHVGGFLFGVATAPFLARDGRRRSRRIR